MKEDSKEGVVLRNQAVPSRPEASPLSASKAVRSLPCISPRGSFLDVARDTLAQAMGQGAEDAAPSWGDTPTSAELDQLAQLERAAMHRRQFPGAGGAAEEPSPPKPRLLAFASPAHHDGGQSAPSGADSGNGRHLKRPASRLGKFPREDLAGPSGLPVQPPRPIPPASEAQLRSEAFPRPHPHVTGAVEPVMCLEAKRPRQGPSAGTPSGPAAPAGPAFGGPSTGLTSPPPTHLEAYLPQEMCAAIRATGSKAPAHLYGWQAECLCRPGVLQGRNLVYCAPTSGGKSLVAEILMLRRIILTGRPVLLVLPFISLCAEKAAHLRRLLAPLERDVLDFYGAQGSAAIGRSTGVIVSTMEKANILLNRLLEEKQVGLLSSVCIDELHMVGDLERGYQLELLLTKLRYAGVAAFPFSSTSDSNTSLSPGQTALERGVQIVGMSATLPNVDAVARWLCAELYVTKFRPVPLRQFLKVGTDIQDESGVVVRQLAPPTEWEKKDPDHVAWLAREAVSEGHSVLIFCASRAACSRTAIFLASMLEVPQRQLVWQPPPDGALAALLPTDIPPCRRAFVEALRRNEAAHPELLAAVEKGIAFHHAGLDSEERELVEGAYKCGAVSVLCATSTLAAGVNLPARRVIFRHPYVGTAANLLDPTKYRQMAGRAGRAGIDTEGEAFLLVLRDAGATKLQALMRAGPTPIESCLTEDRKGMKRAMLEVVASGAVTRPTDVERYIRCTLLAATNSFALVAEATKAALVWLGHKEQGFVYWDEPTGTYQSTAFGRAVLASGLPPELCIHIRTDLSRARDAFVLSTELHLTYLCVPINDDLQPDWGRLMDMVHRLKPAEAAVGERVGLDMGYLTNRARGVAMPSATGGAQSEQERVCRRFWAALILADLLQEMDLCEVQRKYNIGRGVAEGLQERASRYAAMVAAFCERLGWHDLETLVSSFQKRVLVGARPEILALTEVRHVKAYTARLLYKAGIRTPEALASITDYKRVASILAAGRKSQPGGIKANVAREQAMLRQQAVRIVRSAKEYMQWRAQQLKVDAAAALQLAEQISKRPVDPLISAGNGAVHSPAVHQGAVVPSSQSFDLLKAEEERAEEGQGGSSQVSLAQHVPPLAVQTASPPSDEPDPWEGGRAVGAIILTEASQVEALRAFLEGSRRYARFAFQFDSVEPTARALPAGMVMPDRPSAARGPGGKQAPGEHAVQADVKPSVLGVALSWRSGQAFYVPLRNRADLKATVGQIFSNPRLEKVTFDLKGQLAVLRRAWGGAGSSFIGPPFMDVRIAAFMLTPDDSRLWDIQAEPSHLRGPAASKRFSPEALATSRLGQAAVAAAVQSMHRAPNASASDARKIDVCRMAAATCTTFAHLVTQLKADGAAAALAQVEMPIVPVLVTMESSGVGVDPGALRAEMPTLQRRMQELETLAIGVAGEPFDISVPSECSRALFELVGLPPPPAAQAARDGGGWSTKSDALQELAVQYPECPLPGMIAEHRTLTKLLDWCDDLLQRCGASGNGNHSGLVRVRGSFNQTRAITGRLSMDEPNLQTVPRSIEFTVTVTPTSKGAAELAPVTSPDRRRQVCNLRRAFVAPPGRVLLCCDYRQLELRLVAHFSGDPALIHMLSDGAVDPFVGMAATWLKVAPVSAVTLAQRSKAKKMAYGILYGMGRAALARQLGLAGPKAEAEAAEAAKSFLDSLPGVKSWIASVRQAVGTTGTVRTLCGRVRRFPPSPQGDVRARMERQAVSTITQGSASDVAKLAMVAVTRTIASLGGGAALVLQVHDELLLEVDAGRVRDLAREIAGAMERVTSLKVKLPVRTMVGPSWGEMKDLPL